MEEIILKDRSLAENAWGLLLSYLWLNCSLSDLKLCHKQGLVSDQMT